MIKYTRFIIKSNLNKVKLKKDCPVGSIYSYEYALKTARLVQNFKSG